MVIAKTTNLALRFLLELCMLAAFAYWGFTTSNSLLAKIALGIGVPLLAAVVWGVMLAPASSRKLREPYHFILEIILFALAIVALYVAGQTTLALLFAIVLIVNRILLLVWHQ